MGQLQKGVSKFGMSKRDFGDSVAISKLYNSTITVTRFEQLHECIVPSVRLVKLTLTFNKETMTSDR